MSRYFSVILFILCAAGMLAGISAKGYGEELYKATLTPAISGSYNQDVEAKVEIGDNGDVELKIKNLRSSADEQPVNESCVLVIETEINDTSTTYSKSFSVTDGKAEVEFTLEGLTKEDRLEITGVAVNKETTPTATPTPESSPTATPTSTPVATETPGATPEATPTPSATPEATPTPAAASAKKSYASAITENTILVPGGTVSETTAATTPTPVATPGGTITAEVEIKPETINLSSKGKFKAYIKLPSSYSVEDIVIDTVECEGAKAIDGKADDNRYIASFKVQDLDLGYEVSVRHRKGQDDKKVSVELTVTGELEDGTKFEGTDTVSIKGKTKEDKNDDHDGKGNDHRKRGRS